MPTENRSSNTEMVSVPREQLRQFIEYSASVCKSPAWVKDKASLLAALDRPTEQHQGEPIAWMVGSAIWWSKPEAEADAELVGERVIPIGPLADAGEVDRLRKDLLRWKGIAETLQVDASKLSDEGIEFMTRAKKSESEVERLRAEVKRLDLLVAQADYNYDEDRANFKRQLDERDQLLGSAKSALCHLLHNIKISGKRIDLGLAKDSADTVITLINALQAEAKS